MTIPQVGDLAPNFTLPGITMVEGEPKSKLYTLSEKRGHPVVLAFYPADQSPGCTAQLCSYQDDVDLFRALDAEVWGISRQDTTSHEKFARKKRLSFPLLADERGDVVRAYGIGLPGLGLRRSIFIVDPTGHIAWRHVSLVGLTYQKVETITRELEALRARSGGVA